MNPVARFFSNLTLRPQGATLVVAGFLPIFAIVSMYPLVASMIAHFANDPAAAMKVPLMVTAPGLTIALLAPFAGTFIDRFGRRPLVLACTLLYGIFGAAPFFLNNINLIFASRLLLGICEAGILTIVNTLIGDYWDETGRRNWLFIQGVLGPFFASAVILATGMASGIRWNAGFLIYLVAFPIFLAMLVALFEPKRPEDGPVISAQPPVTRFPLYSALIMALVTLLASSFYYVFAVNGSMAFAEIGVSDPGEVSRLTYLPSLFVMAGAMIFKLLGNRSNAVQLGSFLAVLGVGMMGIGMARTVHEMQFAVIIQQIGTGMAVPTVIAWAQTKFPFEHRGRGMGMWTSAFFLGQFGSPLLVHTFAGLTGSMQGAFTVMGLWSAVSGAIAFSGWMFSRSKARDENLVSRA